LNTKKSIHEEREDGTKGTKIKQIKNQQKFIEPRRICSKNDYLRVKLLIFVCVHFWLLKDK